MTVADSGTTTGNASTHDAQTLGGHAHMRGAALTVAIVFHEKLLNGYATVQCRLHTLVGDAEAALSQHLLNAILAALQQAACLQFLHNRVLFVCKDNIFQRTAQQIVAFFLQQLLTA